MGSLLQRKVKNGFAIGPQVPAAFYNATEHILDNLDVWGGHIERDGLNWTITMDEFLDTDGTPATAAGRWKTGEGAAPGTKTTYAARIWGNDSNHRQAIDLDGFSLYANTAAGEEVLAWSDDTTDAAEGVVANFKRPTRHTRSVWYSTDTSIAGDTVSFDVEHGGRWSGAGLNPAAAVFAKARRLAGSSLNTRAHIAGVDSTNEEVVAGAFYSTGHLSYDVQLCRGSDTYAGEQYAARFYSSAGDNIHFYRSDSSANDAGSIRIVGEHGGRSLYASGDIQTGADLFIAGLVFVDSELVLQNRKVDSRLSATPNTGDTTTDGLIDAVRDVITHHGLGKNA